MADDMVLPNWGQMKTVFKTLGLDEGRTRLALLDLLRISEKSTTEFVYIVENVTLLGALTANFAAA